MEFEPQLLDTSSRDKPQRMNPATSPTIANKRRCNHESKNKVKCKIFYIYKERLKH